MTRLAHGSPTETNPTETDGSLDREQAERVLKTVIRLRRGASEPSIRAHLFGTDNPLEQGQMDALDVLIGKDRTMRELAEKLRIEPSTATRAVQRLTKGGLAERYTAPDDGRIVMVRVTEEGRRRHAEVDERRFVALKQIFQGFDVDERQTLVDLLSRLGAAMDELVASVGPTDDT